MRTRKEKLNSSLPTAHDRITKMLTTEALSKTSLATTKCLIQVIGIEQVEKF